jgi:hypothetical protein
MNFTEDLGQFFLEVLQLARGYPFLEMPGIPHSRALIELDGCFPVIEQRLTQGVVDHRLIAKTLALGEGASRLYDGIIQHDGDSGFAFAGGYGTTLGIAEVVFIFHRSILHVPATLVFGSDARGNDSDEIRISIGIRNDQQATFGIHSHDDPPFFIMVEVLKRKRSLVIENRLRF